jgi:hypothetical protein
VQNYDTPNACSQQTGIYPARPHHQGHKLALQSLTQYKRFGRKDDDDR